MSREHDLAGKLTARLAEALSDRERLAEVLGDVAGVRDVDIRTGAPRTDVAVHIRRADAFDLGREVDARDPLVGARRRMTPATRRDLDAIEGPLFEWLEQSKDRPAQFAKDPASVIRQLQGVEPGAALRVAGHLPRSGAPVGRLSGLNVRDLTIDTLVVEPPAVVPNDPVTKGTTAADAVMELALDQLARVLDAEMVAAVRQRAAQLSFNTAVGTATQQGVLSLLLEDATDPRLALDPASPTDTLEVRIGFPESTLELGAGPLVNAVPANLGAVEVRALLKLTSQARTDGGGTTIRLDLVPGSISLTQPGGVSSIPLPVGQNASLRQQLWDAAEAVAIAQLAPFYAFAAPLTFDSELCGIGTRGVTPKFRPSSAETAPSLALFLALLDSTATPPPFDGGASLVPTGADGHLLLSNRLVLELACCLLAQSEVWSGLPSAPTEGPTDADLCCRWKDIGNVTVGGESFDNLKLMEVCADNGLRLYVDLRKGGWGWDARVEITATVSLRIVDGVLSVDTDTTVKITTDIAWWLTVISILAIVGGIALIVIGICKGNPTAIGVGGALVVLGLSLWTLAHLLPPDIRIPTSFDDAILDLLPGGLREKFGALSFLTDATWDDLAIAGYMTVPNEPPLVAGGEVRLAPGQGLDLDTGDVVSASDVPLRLDVDLVLHPSLRDVGMSSGSTTTMARIVPTARFGFVRPGVEIGMRQTLAAFASSRLVALAGRPYPTVSHTDLRGVIFPNVATSVAVPGRGSTPDGDTATVLAARSSAGRLAKVVVWTDAANVTWLRFRTYDTTLLVTLATNHSVQEIGKPGTTDIIRTLNARFQAVKHGPWMTRRGLSHEWYWQGTRVTGVATIDGGARMTVIDDRCTIDTQPGIDLRGAVCVVVRDGDGLAVSACSNVGHIGRIPKPPDVEPPPGSPGGPGGPGLPGGPPHL